MNYADIVQPEEMQDARQWLSGMLDASAASKYVELASTCQRPAPLPLGLMPGTLDE